jgi:hypothetical protein
MLSKKSAEPQSFCAPIAAISRSILQKWPYLLKLRCGGQGNADCKIVVRRLLSAFRNQSLE